MIVRRGRRETHRRGSAHVIVFTALALAGLCTQAVVGQAYFDMEPPGDVPVVFAPRIVSLADPALIESDLSFWPDGLRCVFARYNVETRELSVLEAWGDGADWSDPVPSGLFPDGAFEPSVSPDGQRIFFNPPDFSAPHGALGLRMMEFGSEGWSTPIPLFNGIYASADLDGTLYYTAFYRNKDHIAYRELEGGGYGPEQLVGSNVYDARHEDAHPCIAPDGSYLIFDSETRPRRNACWLFVSFRNEDGSWTEPAHMGGVLGDLPAALARVTPDGRYLFFKADGDVYWVDASVVETLR